MARKPIILLNCVLNALVWAGLLLATKGDTWATMLFAMYATGWQLLLNLAFATMFILFSFFKLDKKSQAERLYVGMTFVHSSWIVIVAGALNFVLIAVVVRAAGLPVTGLMLPPPV